MEIGTPMTSPFSRPFWTNAIRELANPGVKTTGLVSVVPPGTGMARDMQSGTAESLPSLLLIDTLAIRLTAPCAVSRTYDPTSLGPIPEGSATIARSFQRRGDRAQNAHESRKGRLNHSRQYFGWGRLRMLFLSSAREQTPSTFPVTYFASIRPSPSIDLGCFSGILAS